MKPQVPSHNTGLSWGILGKGETRRGFEKARRDSVLPTHSQPWLGEEKRVPGLGGGDINHRKHLSRYYLELKENTRQKGRTSHLRVREFGDHHCHPGKPGLLRFRPGNSEKVPALMCVWGGAVLPGDCARLTLAGHPMGLHNGPVLLLIWWTGQSKATQLGAGGAGIPICTPLATE